MKETKDRDKEAKGEKSQEIKKKQRSRNIKKKMMGDFLSAQPSFHSAAPKQ